MRIQRSLLACALLLIVIAVTGAIESSAGDRQLPQFGRDTVLVWKIQNMDYESSFVVRIADFLPDRFLEWEDEQSQGTIFMPNRDILEAKGFVNSNLFNSGVDSKSKNATTLWLSQQAYRDLKTKKKAKIQLDGVTSLMEYVGDDQLAVEVNRSSMNLPVIKVKDDRGSERWFLDSEDNPLMLRHLIRKYDQTLASVTTDQPNTLRWIKGKKLANMSR